MGVYGVNAEALVGIPDAAVEAAIEAASDFADSAFRARYNLPLLAWGADVKRACAQLAAYDLLVVRGFNPELGADSNMGARAELAQAWLRAVGRQEMHANVTPSPVQTPDFDEPRVITASARGW